MSRIIAISQARLSSTRLPRKILKKILNKTLLEIHLERLKKATLLDEICVATTLTPNDRSIEQIVEAQNVSLSYGSETDVLDRYYIAAKAMRADYIVRITSDCPLIDPLLIDKVIKAALDSDADYFSNILVEHFPDGQDIEVIKMASLEKAWKEGKLPHHREHVTTYIRENCTFNNGKSFSSENYECSGNYNSVRLTVDHIEDLNVIREIILNLGLDQTWEAYASYYLNAPNINNQNKDFVRNIALKKD